ncbi:MAG: esterase, partial [Alphaproteobacteria bacterium]
MSEAFEIRGGRRGGVLLVHGFTGSPHEMAPLARPL